MQGKKWKERKNTMKDGDVILKDGKPTDIIIPVMGPTGVGKSTFINAACGEEVTTVGHELKSCTARIQHAICECPSDPSRRVILVDTPGFDDTYVDDSEILRHIAVWLASSYGDNMKLAGILYFHDISQPRMFGTSRKNLDMFRRLCGEDAEKNVILVTTKWSEVREEVGESREQQLKSSFWQEMIAHGSQVARFLKPDLPESAWDVLEPILANTAEAVALRIQQELVDWGKLIPETDAGNALRATLKELTARHRENMEGLKGKDEQRLKETQKEVYELLKQIQGLKVPFRRRMRGWILSRSRSLHIGLR
ncbi:P-loop containing nucleoside triphosphate hydrolase protein [Suillus tomentosus]|nr:P-loop containing nucleoside triphosphate hydrolase protein [Suillus tomentosus]